MKKIYFLFLALILLFQFFAVASLWNQRPFLDEGRYLASGWMIVNGKTPFADFFSPKPPTFEFLLAFLFLLFGPQLIVARLFMALVSVIQVLLIFLIAKKLFSTKSALFSALFYACLSLAFSAYWAIIAPMTALLSTLILLFTCKLVFEEQSNRAFFTVGLLLGLILLFKQTMILFSAGVLAGILILFTLKKKKISALNLGSLVLGGIIFPSIFLSYLVTTNSLSQFVSAMLFPLTQIGIFTFISFDAKWLLFLLILAPVLVSIAAGFRNTFNAKKHAFKIFLLAWWFFISLANAIPLMSCCTHLLISLPPSAILFGLIIGVGKK